MGLFKFLPTLILASSLLINFALAAQYAHVKAEKAIIYADQELTSPLGFAARGKKIRVGEIPRKYGTILPVLVSGKVAWIKIEDIQFSELESKQSFTLLEHDFAQAEERDELNKNNHLTLTNNVFILGDEWEELSKAAGDTRGTRPQFYSLLFDHRNPSKRYTFGVGLSYINQKQEILLMKALLVDALVFWSPLKFKYITVDLFGGVFMSMDFKLKCLYNETDQDERGEMYGTQAGLQFKYFPYHKFGIVNGLSFHRARIKNVAPIKVSMESGDTKTLKSLTGTNYYLGISYKF